MSIADIKDVLETSSIRIAVLVFFSSIIFFLPDSWFSWALVLGLDLEHYHTETKAAYGIQIFVALIVSLVLLLSHFCYMVWEKWENRKGRLRIVKATYGPDEHHAIDVTARIKKRKERKDGEDFLKFDVLDDVLLAKGKKDDPVPGSDKPFWIEYWYKHIEKYEKGEGVEISEERWQRERDRLKTPAA